MTAFLNRAKILGPFRHRMFAIYMGGNAFSMTGFWIQRTATAWLAWELTHSTTWLGIIVCADLLPTACFGFLAGAVADRWNRLRLLGLVQLLLALQAAALWILISSDQITIWLLLAFTSAHGMLNAISQPVRMVVVPSLVERVEIGPAVAMNAMIFNVARFVGPALGGVIIASVGIAAPYLINAFANAVFLVALVRLAPPNNQSPPNRSLTVVEQLLQAIRYVSAHPGIGANLILVTALGFGGRAATEMLPAFADRIAGSGVRTFALMTVATACGSIVAALWIAGRAHTLSALFRTALAQLLICAIAVILFAATNSLWLALPLLVVAGFGVTAAGISLQTTLQLSVETSIAGRILGLYSQIFRGAPAIGALMLGIASEYIGLTAATSGGTLIIFIVCLWTHRNRARLVASLQSIADKSDRAATLTDRQM